MNRKRLLEVMKASLEWMEDEFSTNGGNWEMYALPKAEIEERDAWPQQIVWMRIAVKSLENGYVE